MFSFPIRYSLFSMLLIISVAAIEDRTMDQNQDSKSSSKTAKYFAYPPGPYGAAIPSYVPPTTWYWCSVFPSQCYPPVMRRHNTGRNRGKCARAAHNGWL